MNGSFPSAFLEFLKLGVLAVATISSAFAQVQHHAGRLDRSTRRNHRLRLPHRMGQMGDVYPALWLLDVLDLFVLLHARKFEFLLFFPLLPVHLEERYRVLKLFGL